MAFIKRRAVSGNNSRSGTYSSSSSMVVVNGRTPFDKRNGSGSFDVPDDDGSWPREGEKVPRKGRARGAVPSSSRSFWFRVFCLTGVCFLSERFDTSHQFLCLFILLNFVHFFGVIAFGLCIMALELTYFEVCLYMSYVERSTDCLYVVCR